VTCDCTGDCTTECSCECHEALWALQIWAILARDEDDWTDDEPPR
jgi:hypothetical protein